MIFAEMQENTRIRQETGAAETLRTHMKPGVAEMHQKVVRLVRSRNCGNAKKRNQTASGFARCALRKCTFTLRFRYKTAVGNSKFHPVFTHLSIPVRDMSCSLTALFCDLLINHS